MSQIEVRDESHKPVWMQSFSDGDRQSQLSDDSEAWRNVTGLLLLVVIVGLIIALGAVYLSS